jgi:clan AA aspartic protease
VHAVNGFVDEELRALVDISVSATKGVTKTSLRVWIDTAFNGGLVIPREQIRKLKLKKSSTTQAVLADGQTVELETYSCLLEWFGKEYRTQVVANDGAFPLLGTILLADRRLNIDYVAKSLTLE